MLLHALLLLRSGEFGDGSDEADWGDGAEGWIEEEVFDERRRGRGFGCGFGAGFARQQSGDDLQVEEHGAGAGGIEVIGGDAAEDVRGDGEGGGAVLDEREDEGLVRVDVPEFAGRGRWPAVGVVVVAELLLEQGG